MIFFLLGLMLQQVALKHPGVRKKLELPDKEAILTEVSKDETEKSSVIEKYPSEGRINIHDLSPQELVAVRELTHPISNVV